eukprot:746463-Hanusia_phi.AAC.2
MKFARYIKVSSPDPVAAPDASQTKTSLFSLREGGSIDGSAGGAERDDSEEYKGVSSLVKQRFTRQQYFSLASTLAEEPKVR